MKPSLTDEQRQALNQQPEGIEVEDVQTQKVYFITDAEQHQRAMQALQRQEDHDAWRIGDMRERLDVSTGIGKHIPPGRRWTLNAESEEGQRCLENDDAPDG